MASCLVSRHLDFTLWAPRPRFKEARIACTSAHKLGMQVMLVEELSSESGQLMHFLFPRLFLSVPIGLYILAEWSFDREDCERPLFLSCRDRKGHQSPSKAFLHSPPYSICHLFIIKMKLKSSNLMERYSLRSGFISWLLKFGWWIDPTHASVIAALWQLNRCASVFVFLCEAKALFAYIMPPSRNQSAAP